jgi:hypothetical protein
MVHKNWLVFDNKTYLIEYLGKTTGGVQVAINGTEASYLLIATENGGQAEFFCGSAHICLQIDRQNVVSLSVNNSIKPPCSAELANKFKTQKKKATISLGLVIVVTVTLLICDGIIFQFETSHILKSGTLTSLGIFAIYVVLHFSAHQNDYAIWLSLGLVVTALAVLISAMIIDMGTTDFRGLLLYLLPRPYCIVNMSIFSILAVQLFRLAFFRYTLQNKG